MNKGDNKNNIPNTDEQNIKENNREDSDYDMSRTSSEFSDLLQKSITELLSCDDIKNFNPEEFSNRKYNKNNINAGKIFFKYRYIMTKIEELSVKKPKTELRNTLTLESKEFEKIKKIIPTEKRLSIPLIQNQLLNLNKNEDMFNDKNNFRNFNSKFLTIVEKSILHFNLKKFKESFKVLYQENIINSEEEFGEFLLVISGYDKNIIGTFLSKDKPPNENKKVINGFINSIDLKYMRTKNINNNNYFLDCLRFLLSRLNLPQDANLILQIMDTYSSSIFNTNKDNGEFLSKYSSINAIYLLISTLLALNTMFTRKDIKNMNIIKKEQFLEMNKDIEVNEAKDIYDNLEKNPISLSYNYHDIIYQKMTVLVKEKDKSYKKSMSTILDSNNLVFDKKNIKEDVIEEDLDENSNDNDSNEQNDNDNDIESLNLNAVIDKNNVPNHNNNKNLSFNTLKTMKKFNTSININNNCNFNNNDNDYNSEDEKIRQISFSYRENLYNFSDKDKSILTNPTKFIKLINKNSHHQRMFIVDEKLEKLMWAKEIEVIVNSDKSVKISKTKGNVHTLLISEIENVHNGIEKSKLISEYIKNYPNESKEANHFITINTSSKSFCIKAVLQEIGLSWFKALKSLVIQFKNTNINNNSNNNNIRINNIKFTVKKFWYTMIIPNWDIYGNYLNYKARNKIYYPKQLNKKDNNSFSKNCLIEEKTTFSLQERERFLTEATNKLTQNYFDYNEFLYFYKLGLPNKIREKIWAILIGNKCGINKKLYKKFREKIPEVNFEEVTKEYEKNKSISQSLINIKEENNKDKDKNKLIQKIIDIIEVKDHFIIKYTVNPNKILSLVYKINQVFFLMRPDFKYNKSLVGLSFLFILVFKDEYKSFCFLYNLICSTNILQYYSKNENYIDSRVKFFDSLLKSKIPKVSTHFKNLDISSELFLVSWFENIFSVTLDYYTLRRVFDLYLLHGEHILFEVALTIIKIQEDELLNFTISDVFRVLKKLPNEYKEENFMEKLFLNDIYLEYETWKKNRDIERQIDKLSLIFK